MLRGGGLWGQSVRKKKKKGNDIYCLHILPMIRT